MRHFQSDWAFIPIICVHVKTAMWRRALTRAAVRARQAAVHAVGVLGVRLSVLAGDTRALLQVPLAFLVDVGPCKGENKGKLLCIL